jgi:hypothetical protein
VGNSRRWWTEQWRFGKNRRQLDSGLQVRSLVKLNPLRHQSMKETHDVPIHLVC